MENRPWKKARIGFYLEVEMEGRDVVDAIHRAEDALGITLTPESGDKVRIYSHHLTGETQGTIRKFKVLDGHLV